MTYTAGTDKHGNNVVWYKKGELESVVVVIPTWWSNGPQIAKYLSDSINRNTKLKLITQI